jgi:GNAT superfamily N-acetyltransferase
MVKKHSKEPKSARKRKCPKPLQPLNLGNFVFEEKLTDGYASDATGEEGEDKSDDDDDQVNSISTWRTFSCATKTEGGRVAALRIKMLQTYKVDKRYWVWNLYPYTLEGEFVIDSTPFTFVLKRKKDERTVEDIRVYLKQEFRSRGFAHLLISFVKAFFFPFFTTVPGLPKPIANLPLGGSWVVERLSVLPTARIAKRFYRKQGFRAFDGENKWLFWPASLTPSSMESSLAGVVGPDIMLNSEEDDVSAGPPTD